MGVGSPPLDAVFLKYLQQRFATWKEVQPRLTNAYTRLATWKNVQHQLPNANTRLIVHMLGVLSHALGEHQPNRDWVAPISLLRTIKAWHILSALRRSPDERIKRRQRFAFVERGNIILPLPCPITCTRYGEARPGNTAQETAKGVKHDRASSACRYVGKVKFAVRTLILAGAR